tara:strand:+ start:870 stop:1019 length:150 start_codon:yes stop_codon:yes gene_type:complete
MAYTTINKSTDYFKILNFIMEQVQHNLLQVLVFNQIGVGLKEEILQMTM